MKFKDFIDLYDNWNGIVVVNNDNLTLVERDRAYIFVDDDGYCIHWNKEVVSFGFYDNELCVRVK